MQPENGQYTEREQEYISQKSAEIRGRITTGPQAIRNEVNTPQTQTMMTRMLGLVIRHLQKATTEGKYDAAKVKFEGQANVEGTDKNLITVIKTLIKEIIRAIGGDQGNQLLPVPPDSPSGRFLRRLSTSIAPGEINDNAAPYLLELIQKAINNGLQNPLQDAENRTILQNLQIAAGGPKTHLYQEVVNSFINAANINPDDPEALQFKEEVSQHAIAKAGEREKIEEIKQKREEAQIEQLQQSEGLTPTDRAYFREISNEVNRAIASKVPAGAEPAEADRLQDEWWNKVNKYLDEESPDHHLVEQVRTQIFGGNDDRMKQYKELSTKSVGSVTGRDFETFGITEDDFKALNADVVLQDIENNIGQYFRYNEKENILELTPEAGRRLRAAAVDLAEKVLSDVRQTPGEWREAFDQLSHGMVLRSIRQHIVRLAQNTKIREALQRPRTINGRQVNGAGSYVEYSRFLNSSVIGQMNEELELSEQYKSLARFIFQENATPEDLAKFARHRYASQISSFFLQDKAEKALFNLAISEFERHIQGRIGFNKDNEIPVTIFSGFFNQKRGYENKDIEDFRTKLQKQLERLARDGSGVDDEIREYFKVVMDRPGLMNRIMSFAPGFSLMNTLRGIELVASGRSRPGHDYKDQKLAAIVSYVHNWNTGRRGGREMVRFSSPEDKFLDYRYGSGFKMSELMAAPMHMDQDRRNIFQRFIDSVFKGDRWNPSDLFREVYPQGSTGAPNSGIDLAAALQGRVLTDLNDLDAADPHTGVTFADMLKEFQMMGYYSRGGWRFDSVKKWWDTEIKDKRENPNDPNSTYGEWGKNWNQMYKGLPRYVGASSLWMVAQSRASSEIKEAFLQKKLGDNYKNKYQPVDLDNIWRQYFEDEKGKQGVFASTLIKEIPFFRDSVDREFWDMTIHECIDAKTTIYQGLAMQALLYRSPYDFLLTMSQVEPELIKIVDVGSDAGGNKEKVTAYQYYFTGNYDNILTPQQKENKEYFMRHLWKRYGRNNLLPVEKIAEFWDDLYTNDKLKNQDGTFNPETARARYSDALSEAINKVRLKNEAEMKVEHIEYEDPELQQHFRNVTTKLWSFFKDTYKEQYADGPNQELLMGEKKFFYRMAVNWNRDHPGIVPNTNDLNQHAFFEYVEETDEKIYARLWGDINGYNKATAKIIDFDNLLMRMAISGDKKELLELHGALQGLEGSIGEGTCNKWNYIIAQSVIRFFQEDYKQRTPFPTNFLTGLFMDPRTKALSTINKTADSMTWKEEDIRAYVRQLRLSGFLAEKGMWSEEQLLKAVGADTLKYFGFQAGPSIASVIFAFTFWSLLKAAYEAEMKPESGKK